MSKEREISAFYELKQNDNIGALDCILQIIEMIMSKDSTEEERNTKQNDSK
jgi:hypothetical protein